MRHQLKIIIILLFIVQVSAPVHAQSVQQDLLSRINGLRSSLGLAPYTLNSALSGAANSHAQWMVATSQVTHIQENGSSPRTRANANGYNSQWVSENIYMGGLAGVDSAWNFWINSGIHYAGLTSPNYQDVGIGTAQGDGGQAFVLVFGVPSGGAAAARQASGGGAGNAASAPPLPIVGYDAVGNIQYELQAGDTLGDVLLTFGYTWDDLNTVLDLNEFTDADIRSLDVGQVVLVPPPQGTYTPTPLVEVTEELITTESPSNTPIATATLMLATESQSNQAPVTPISTTTPLDNSQTSGIIPTPDNSVQVAQQASASPTPTIIGEAIGEPVVFDASLPTATATLTQIPSPIPTLQINSVSVAEQATEIILIPTDIPIIGDSNPAQPSNTPPMWLIVAIVLQVGILGFASVEYIRRMRKK